MYSITHRDKTWRSGELQRAIGQIDHPDTMRHLSAIESLEARGAQYSNHDFDVLSAALSFIDRNARPPAVFNVGDSVRFTHLYSHERTGQVLRRWWSGCWSYAVSDPIAGHGEWLLSESSLSPA